MPSNVTPVDAFTTPIVVPDDGDPLNAASVLAAFQPLANQSLNTKTRLESVYNFTTNEFVYPVTKTREKFFGVSRALFGVKDPSGVIEWVMPVSPGAPVLYARSVANPDRARMWIPIDLPEGSVIKSWQCFVTKGANNASAADQIGCTIYMTGGFALFPSFPEVSTGVGGSIQRAGSGTGRAAMGVSGLTHPFQGNADYYAWIEGPTIEHINDRIWGVKIGFEDAGPRP